MKRLFQHSEFPKSREIFFAPPAGNLDDSAGGSDGTEDTGDNSMQEPLVVEIPQEWRNFLEEAPAGSGGVLMDFPTGEGFQEEGVAVGRGPELQSKGSAQGNVEELAQGVSRATVAQLRENGKSLPLSPGEINSLGGLKGLLPFTAEMSGRFWKEVFEMVFREATPAFQFLKICEELFNRILKNSQLTDSKVINALCGNKNSGRSALDAILSGGKKFKADASLTAVNIMGRSLELFIELSKADIQRQASANMAELKSHSWVGRALGMVRGMQNKMLADALMARTVRIEKRMMHLVAMARTKLQERNKDIASRINVVLKTAEERGDDALRAEVLRFLREALNNPEEFIRRGRTPSFPRGAWRKLIGEHNPVALLDALRDSGYAEQFLFSEKLSDQAHKNAKDLYTKDFSVRAQELDQLAEQSRDNKNFSRVKTLLNADGKIDIKNVKQLQTPELIREVMKALADQDVSEEDVFGSRSVRLLSEERLFLLFTYLSKEGREEIFKNMDFSTKQLISKFLYEWEKKTSDPYTTEGWEEVGEAGQKRFHGQVLELAKTAQNTLGYGATDYKNDPDLRDLPQAFRDSDSKAFEQIIRKCQNFINNYDRVLNLFEIQIKADALSEDEVRRLRYEFENLKRIKTMLQESMPKWQEQRGAYEKEVLQKLLPEIPEDMKLLPTDTEEERYQKIANYIQKQIQQVNKDQLEARGQIKVKGAQTGMTIALTDEYFQKRLQELFSAREALKASRSRNIQLPGLEDFHSQIDRIIGKQTKLTDSSERVSGIDGTPEPDVRLALTFRAIARRKLDTQLQNETTKVADTQWRIAQRVSPGSVINELVFSPSAHQGGRLNVSSLQNAKTLRNLHVVANRDGKMILETNDLKIILTQPRMGGENMTHVMIYPKTEEEKGPLRADRRFTIPEYTPGTTGICLSMSIGEGKEKTVAGRRAGIQRASSRRSVRMAA